MPSPEIDDDELRASCERQVDRLGLPHHFTTRDLREAIAKLHGKPIVIKPLNTLGAIDTPCGIRLETPAADILFYEEGTSLNHRRHILTHELCHVYCDHPGALAFDANAARTLGVNPTLVMRMSGRTSYTTTDEREAEMMATVLRQRIYRERQTPPRQPLKGPDIWDALFSQPVRISRFHAR